MCFQTPKSPPPALISAASAYRPAQSQGNDLARRFAAGPAANILTSPVGIVAGNSSRKLGVTQ